MSNLPLAVYLATLAGAVALKFVDYTAVLYAVAGMAAVPCLWVAFSRKPPEAVFQAMFFLVSAFALIAVSRGATGLAMAGLAAWGWRGAVRHVGILSDFPMRRFMLKWMATSVALWCGWDGTLFAAAAWGLVFLGVARLVSSRIVNGGDTLVGEVASAGALAILFGLDAANLVFLRSPVNAAFISIAAGFLMYWMGITRKGTAFIFSAAGTAIFAGAGHEAFSLYFLFTLLMEAGGRLRFPEEGTGPPPSFWVLSFIASACATVAAGADDPFPFYFALAGALSAGVFHIWSGAGRQNGKIFWGMGGASLLSAFCWMTAFIPSAGAPLVLLSSVAAYFAPMGESALEHPGRDGQWMMAGAGALAAVALFAVTPFFP
ncbi:MAG: hypothetical protein HZA04_01815 [Nitrospinae bacterium]|nr:hypothetical protein [Nitrospinota bacterium]